MLNPPVSNFPCWKDFFFGPPVRPTGPKTWYPKASESKEEKKAEKPSKGVSAFFLTFGGCIFHVYQDILKISTPSSLQLRGLHFCFNNFFDPRPFKFWPFQKPLRRGFVHHVSGPVGRTGGPKRKSFQGEKFEIGGFNIFQGKISISKGTSVRGEKGRKNYGNSLGGGCRNGFLDL